VRKGGDSRDAFIDWSGRVLSATAPECGSSFPKGILVCKSRVQRGSDGPSEQASKCHPYLLLNYLPAPFGRLSCLRFSCPENARVSSPYHQPPCI
jgi:hypothetical protein